MRIIKENVLQDVLRNASGKDIYLADKHSKNLFFSKEENVVANLLGLEVNLEDEIPDVRRYNSLWAQVPEELKVRDAICFDFETTGYYGYAVSIGIVKIDMLRKSIVKDSKYYLFNPLVQIPEEASKVNGLYMEDVEGESSFEDRWAEIKKELKGDLWVGQNLVFDAATIERELARLNKVNPFAGMPIFDTMSLLKPIILAKGKTGKLKDPNLKEVCDFFNIPVGEEDYHNALFDAEQTAKAFIASMSL